MLNVLQLVIITLLNNEYNYNASAYVFLFSVPCCIFHDQAFSAPFQLTCEESSILMQLNKINWNRSGYNLGGDTDDTNDCHSFPQSLQHNVRLEP
jgi:hypothetical protein